MIQLSWIYWDPPSKVFTLPGFDLPIRWYGVLFALGFMAGFSIFVAVLTRFWGKEHKREAVLLTDRLTVYMIVATVVGARLGHFLFYERPEGYVSAPWQILRIWEGGLASHGAAVGIIVALILFSRKEKKLDWIRLLDFVAVPTAFVGFCIRMGNFINQEVLGVETSVPWAVVFGHPLDGSAIVPRHPVQLYEAFAYLAIFGLLWRLSKTKMLFERGKLIGLFLMLVFGFRFVIEHFKEEASPLMDSTLTMGQVLSVPLIALGCFFYFFLKRRS